jgi:hypothetical protein
MKFFSKIMGLNDLRNAGYESDDHDDDYHWRSTSVRWRKYEKDNRTFIQKFVDMVGGPLKKLQLFEQMRIENIRLRTSYMAMRREAEDAGREGLALLRETDLLRNSNEILREQCDPEKLKGMWVPEEKYYNLEKLVENLKKQGLDWSYRYDALAQTIFEKVEDAHNDGYEKGYAAAKKEEEKT